MQKHVGEAAPSKAEPPVAAEPADIGNPESEMRAAMAAAIERWVGARRILCYASEPALALAFANVQVPLRCVVPDAEVERLQEALRGEDREVRRRSETDSLPLWPADLVILEVVGEEFAGSPELAHAQVSKGGALAILGPPVQNDDVDLELMGIFRLDSHGALVPAGDSDSPPFATLFTRRTGPEIPRPMSGMRRIATFTNALDALTAPQLPGRKATFGAKVAHFLHEENALRGWLSDNLARCADKLAREQPASAAQLFLDAMEMRADASLEERVALLAAGPAPNAREWGRFIELATHLVRRDASSPAALELILRVLEREPLRGRALSYRIRAMRARSIKSMGADVRRALAQAEEEEARLREQTRGLPPILFFSLGNAGASAVHPILSDILTRQFHYDSFANPAYSMFIEAAFSEGPNPLFNWTHHPLHDFPNVERRPEQKILCLYRDPRDVVVSRAKQGYADGFAPRDVSENEYMVQIIGQVRAWFENAEIWRKAFPERTLVFAFDEMKRDLPALVRRIFSFLGLLVSEETLSAAIEAHSYEAYAKRKEGESGETVRTAYMWRKGISGDWRNHFDLELRQHFEDVCGHFLRIWGYEPDASWVNRP
jgi:hypothetical protein